VQLAFIKPKTLSIMSKFNLQNLYRDVNVSLEFISPDEARNYLLHNFANNRPLKTEHLKDLTREMKMSRFFLSSDAITFESDGQLTNGQHRLSAVVESGTIQPFIVIKNMLPECKSIIDVGKKRMMADRITVSGVKISTIYCSAVRHAMAVVNNRNIGTTEYARPSHDDLVASQYIKHKEFFDILTEVKLSHIRAFWMGGALKIYAEMKSKPNKIYPHGMNALDRTLHWIYIVTTGCSDVGPVQKEYDIAAIKVQQKALTRKQQDNKYWCDPEAWCLTVAAAHHFMTGTGITNLYKASKDPFTPFKRLPSTNN